mgnify:CR=1 FL=1
MAEAGKKTRQFRAEVRKVLHILTNSLYTNREIFLRELISNASDALDKLRFRINRGESPREPDLPLEIRISIDKDAKTLTIADTGLGMTAEELADNLGTIAKSGSEEFLAGLAAESGTRKEKSNGKGDGVAEDATADAANIIGRFGVGFYSVFMVADKVEVTSRPAFEKDAQAHVWISDGLGSYSVALSDAEEPKRGTVVKAHLKDDAVEFLEKFRVESAIRKHSAFVPFPVFVDGERINTQPALWREPKSSVTKEQYDNFYKALTYDAKDPLDVQHISVDAPVQFNALLYIPDSSQDFFGADRDFWGLDLYARRVLIQHRNKELIPEYLAFLKGVVDTEDLPLNISRETLQENVLLRKINQVIVKQTLGHLEKIARDDVEKYNRFWRLHGKIFKLGYHDFPNRERVSALLRFNSSALADAEALTSLDDVARIGRMSFQELFSVDDMEHAEGWRKLLCNVYFSTIITLVFGFILTKIGYANIWPLFGSANQLLSALVLATLCVFLKVTGRNNKMIFPPLIIMLCVTFTALVQRLIAMVKAISTAASVTIPAGETTWGAVFIANGLQLILAVLLIVLGLNIVVHSFKAYQKAEQNSEVKA